MSKYRIVYVNKPGYYDYYEVQERIFLFFWVRMRTLDTLKQCEAWIKDQEVVETRRVIKKNE